MSVRVFVCMCVCLSERERESVCEREREIKRKLFFIDIKHWKTIDKQLANSRDTISLDQMFLLLIIITRILHTI